ncbi:hypothetical protein J1614_003578 [Plenodomus biglobosus]|nr:hypothetical protein J1614_003578 [Plenodomus biglobosus]
MARTGVHLEYDDRSSPQSYEHPVTTRQPNGAKIHWSCSRTLLSALLQRWNDRHRENLPTVTGNEGPVPYVVHTCELVQLRLCLDAARQVATAAGR